MFRSIRNFILGTLSELIVIIGILLAFYLVLTWLGIPTKINTQQSITLEFEDASQLAAGSPVRWMGVDVGYVESVKPDKNHIVVRMRTEPGTPKIPPGSHFTIEFNGLAGAKSLEITQPGKRPLHKGTLIKGFDVQKPIRLQDVQDTSILVAEGLQYSMDNIRKSLEEMDQTMPLNKQVGVFNNDIKNFTNDLMTVDKRLTLIEKGLNEDTEDVVNTLNSFSNVFKDMPNAKDMNKVASKHLGQMNEIMNSFSSFINGGNAQKTLEQFNAFQKNLFEQLGKITPKNTAETSLETITPPKKWTSDDVNNQLIELKTSTEKLKDATAKLAK